MKNSILEKRDLDPLDSWWINLLRHCHPIMSESIKNQFNTLEYIMMGGFKNKLPVAISKNSSYGEMLAALVDLNLHLVQQADALYAVKN